MKNILILYATTHGQTAKIARHIRSHLAHKLNGHASYFRVQNICDPIDDSEWPAVWDLVVIGAPLYIGHYSSRLRRWLLNNKDKIKSPASAFFSVSLSAAEPSRETEEAGQALRNSFYNRSQWYPQIEDSFAGAINYLEYSWWLRLIMRRKSRLSGGPTDTQKNYDLTDWNRVDEFATNLGKFLDHVSMPNSVASAVRKRAALPFMNSAGKVSLGLVGFLTLATGLYFEQWWWSLLGLLILGGLVVQALFWYAILD
ncbi:MAG: flavodoxin domain-containing protein [Bdellovibrio sp.]|jgi:menaquinone-dependent protoporphyrinogen oxidase